MSAYDISGALTTAVADGGVTVDLDGSHNPRSTGYYVGGLYASLVFDSVEAVDRGEVAWWVGTHPANYYGLWVDSETGKVYIDAVDWQASKTVAVQLGQARKEIAVWDIARNEEIRCGAPEATPTVSGYKVGDYVIADRAETDFWPETWVIHGFSKNAFGSDLVDVHEVGNEQRKTCFYPSELSLEDGSQPQGG